LLLLLSFAGISLCQHRRLQCPKGVKSFSAGPKSPQYYKCDAHGVAELSSCPEGQIYHMKKTRCISESRDNSLPDHKPIEMKVLGRDEARLGAVYDAKKNEFYFTYSIWDQTTIDAAKTRYKRKEVTTEFRADQTTIEKLDNFNIEADLSLDVMSGQVSVSGAMNYLKDVKESEQQLNVELLYHTTKYTEVLPKWTPPDNTAFGCDTDYTHIVTSVTYGMDANMRMQYLLQESDSAENIYGSLKISVNSIPSFNISGSGSVNISSHDKDIFDACSIQVEGDYDASGVDLEKPKDFETAVAYYGKLPELLGLEDEWWPRASIIEAHLTPINEICTDTEMLLLEISEGMLKGVIDLLNQMEMLMTKVSGFTSLRPYIKFKPLKSNIDDYMGELDDYQNDLNRNLTRLVPDIRGGDDASESDLTDLITWNLESPWNYDVSEKFLMDRGREISAISFLLNTVSGAEESDNIKIADFLDASEIDVILDYKRVLELNLTILAPKGLTEDFIAGNPQDEKEFWYNDISKNGQVGYLLRLFDEFSMANFNDPDYGFLIVLNELDVENPDDNAFVFTFERQGANEEFNIPTNPPMSPVSDVSYDSATITVQKENANCDGVLVSIFAASTDTIVKTQTFSFSVAENGEEEDFRLTGLSPATIYYFQVAYTTIAGKSPASKNNPRFMTGPSDAPSNLILAERATDSIQFEWSAPGHIGDGITEQELMYSCTIQGYNGYEATIETPWNVKMAKFEGLDESADYVVSLIAYLPYSAPNLPEDITHTSIILISKSAATSLAVTTNPLAPTMIPSLPGEVTVDSAYVRWEAPEAWPDHYPFNAYYDLKIRKDGDESSAVGVALDFTQTGWLFYDLEEDTLYSVNIQIIFDEDWMSPVSEPLLIHTKSTKSDLDKFTDEVEEDVEEIRVQANMKSSFCASAVSSNTQGTLTYDQVDVSLDTVGSDLNAGTGLFTAGASGYYQVVMSMTLEGSSSESHDLWFIKSSAKVEESHISWSYHNNLYGTGYDNASKDMILHLSKGDTLGVHHEKSSSQNLENISFCVNSVKLD